MKAKIIKAEAANNWITFTYKSGVHRYVTINERGTYQTTKTQNNFMKSAIYEECASFQFWTDTEEKKAQELRSINHMKAMKAESQAEARKYLLKGIEAFRAAGRPDMVQALTEAMK